MSVTPDPRTQTPTEGVLPADPSLTVPAPARRFVPGGSGLGRNLGLVVALLLLCVLGVATGAYLPYCFFNILSPVLDVTYGFLGFKVPTIPRGPSSDAMASSDGQAGPPTPDTREEER